MSTTAGGLSEEVYHVKGGCGKITEHSKSKNITIGKNRENMRVVRVVVLKKKNKIDQFV